MWKPWAWARSSNEAAVVNARSACTVLSRRRVERLEVELYLTGLYAERPAAPDPRDPARLTRPAGGAARGG